MKTYIKVVVFTLATLVVCMAGFNWTVDPYRVFGKFDEVEYYEPNVRLWKTRAILSRDQELGGYIMGNSRAAQFPAEALARPGCGFFNYATSSECINETYSKLAFLYRSGAPVKELVLFVSWDSFTEMDLDEPNDLLRQEHPAVRNHGTWVGLYCRYLLSLEGVGRSIEALHCRKGRSKAMHISADGSVTYLWFCTEKNFEMQARQQVGSFDKERAQKILEWHRKIATLARLNGTRVCLVIEPLPAPSWNRLLNDAQALAYLSELAGLYGSVPVLVQDEELYRDYRNWNDPAHCTREALERFFLPLVSDFLRNDGAKKPADKKPRAEKKEK